MDPSRDRPPPPKFTEFYRAHHEELLRFALHYGAAHLDLEDIVAEAWARACTDWPAIRQPRPWLYRVVINLIHDAGRAARQARPAGDPFAGARPDPLWTSAGVLPGADWSARVSEIAQALQQLPPKQRAAVLLDYQGFPRAEIAEALGCATVTVRVHLHHGRAALKRTLSEPAAVTEEVRRTGMEGRPA